MNSQNLKGHPVLFKPFVSTTAETDPARTEDEQEDRGGIIELSCPQFEQFQVKHGVDIRHQVFCPAEIQYTTGVGEEQDI